MTCWCVNTVEKGTARPKIISPHSLVLKSPIFNFLIFRVQAEKAFLGIEVLLVMLVIQGLLLRMLFYTNLCFQVMPVQYCWLLKPWNSSVPQQTVLAELASFMLQRGGW